MTIELSHEAKEEIRTYLLKFIAPSAGILTILSGVIGYTLSGVARIEALDQATKATIEARVQSTEALADADRARKSVTEAAAYVEGIKSQVDSVLSGNYDVFTKALIGDDKFRSEIGKIANADLEALKGDVRALGSALKVRVLASATIRGGRLESASPLVTYDPPTGTLTFPNADNLKPTIIVSTISAGGVYNTEDCYLRGSVTPTSVVVWQGALDTGDRNWPPKDCAVVVIGAGD